MDVARANRRRFGRQSVGQDRIVPLADRLLELGKHGRATGAGWYRYPGGQRVEDPIVADLAVEEAHFGGLAREDYEADDIVSRICAALIVEAVMLVGEGHEPPRVDRVAVDGLGFPAAKGGPLAYGRATGLARLRADLAEFSREDGTVWSEPADLENILASPLLR